MSSPYRRPPAVQTSMNTGGAPAEELRTNRRLSLESASRLVESMPSRFQGEHELTDAILARAEEFEDWLNGEDRYGVRVHRSNRGTG